MDENAGERVNDRSTGYAKGAARRAHIVDVATSFFGRSGYRGATMLAIAEACGISRAGLLHHFPTKESLLEAVLAERDRKDGLRAVDDEEFDGLAVLSGLVRLVEHNTTTPAIVHLYAVLSAEAGDPSHPAHQYFLNRYQRSRSLFARAWSDVAARGLLTPGADPDVLAVELVALMDGLQVQWLLEPDQIDMAAQVRRHLDAVLLDPLE